MSRTVFRLRAVQVVFALALLLLLGRVVQVQLVQGEEYEAQARAGRTEFRELPAPRGAIYDRNGVALALTQEMYHVDVTPGELRDRDADVEQIAKHLGLSEADARRTLRRRYAYLPGPFNSAQVQPLRGMRGVYLRRELARFHPIPGLARAVLGHPVSSGRPASGVERVMDTLLTGVPGRAVVLRDQVGRAYESPRRLDAFPVPGHDVHLTIDADLQDLVERALLDAIERYDARGGDVVVLDPATGEILALASFGKDGNAKPGVFTAVFEPGSTAKLFAAAALLRHDLVDPGNLSDIEWGEGGSYTMGHRTIHDHDPEGWMTLRDVIRRSSNIGIAKFGRRLSPEQQFLTLRDFGLGTPTGVEYPAESAGLLRYPHQWSAASSASLAMGYEVAVTPLQLAQAYAAIAYNGVLMRPALIRTVHDHKGKEIYSHTPQAVRRVIDPGVARDLRAMLRAVVYDGGTGESVALTTYEVAGKTGTARRAGPGGYVPGSYTTNFVCLFPADDPQLVMVVKLDDPEGVYARLSAVPLTKSMLEQILAGQSGALDYRRLGGQVTVPDRAPPVGTGAVPYVVSWPMLSEPHPPGERKIPDVRGLSVRAAARALHELGLRVYPRGVGVVQRVSPASGTAVAAGTVVRLLASDAMEPRE